MKPIIYGEKGFEIKNPSPFLITILKMKKQREERAKVRTQREMRNIVLKTDKEYMEK